MKYSEASTEAAYFHLTREQRDVDVVATFTIPGEPVSKARARFTGYGSKIRSYTPAKTMDGEAAVRRAFLKKCPGFKADDFETFGLTAIFFCGTRQRRDVDNMVKLICDGLNGVLWVDDNQVVEVSARKTPEVKEDARTEVVVYRVGGMPGLAKKSCELCGEAFEVYPGTRRRFCSKACGQKGKAHPSSAHIVRPLAPCPVCGGERKRPRTPTCSKACGMKVSSQKKQAATHCASGHEFTPENTYVYQQGGYTMRRCRTCNNEKRAKRRADMRRDPERGPHAITITIEEIQ